MTMSAQHDIALQTNDLPFNILTDLQSPAEWKHRADAGRRTNAALEDLFTMIETRKIKIQNGQEMVLPPQAITLEQAELFYYLITETKPILSLETGFHLGLAASVITAAHMMNGLNGGHIPIQEQAREVDQGIGLYTLQRLNLSGYQIMEHEPALVLPQIYLQQINDGLRFAYFSSAEDFEEQMMEYFYVNKLLNENGIFAINMASPTRRDLLDYIRKVRHDYAIRELDCGIALVQKPAMTHSVKYTGVKH
jgi:hypothetical protein